MNIKEVINNDFKIAFKEKDDATRSVLTMLKSAIKNKEIDLRVENLSDEQVADVIISEAKKRKDSVEQYRAGGREDLAQNEEKEVSVLMKYMPKQLSEDEITDLVDQAISEVGAKDIKDLGKVMVALKDKTKGKADGSVVSGMVKKKLS